jgi:hypothetical protein
MIIIQCNVHRQYTHIHVYTVYVPVTDIRNITWKIVVLTLSCLSQVVYDLSDFDLPLFKLFTQGKTF